MNPLILGAERVPTDPDDLIGAVLAERYRLVRILGQGGMGHVYLAQHIALDKPIAVKVLATRWAKEQEFRDRFLREATATSKIRHENVVEIHDFGVTPNNSVFMAMELLHGETLADLLAREGALPWLRAKRIVLQLCRALHAAHERGVLHRDVKPENCFRMKRGSNRDFIRVIDFGIAKVVGDERDPNTSLSRAGSVFGTPEYMSPEQARGKPVDARTDVYSTGIALYEMVTGEVPFSGATLMDILTRQVMHEPMPPSVAAPHMGISAELEATILRALQKNPDQRFPTMRALAEAIAAVPTSTPVTRVAVPGARTDSPTASSLPTSAKNLYLAIIVLLAATVLVLVGLVVWLVGQRG